MKNMNDSRFIGRALPASLVVGIAASLISVALTVGYKRYYSVDFLFGDHGVTILAAEEILSGKLLFRDVAMPYGPASVYAYAGTAALFGNHIRTYLLFHGCFSVIFVFISYKSISRF